MLDYGEVAGFGVATIYEASEKHGLIDVSLLQLTPKSRAAGPARTVLCGQDDNLMVHAVIERIQPGEIVVLTMPQPRAISLVGDLLATQMIAAGAAGLLVDAAVRDSEDLATMGMPVWARYVRARSATKELVGKLDVVVTIGAQVIAPGDIVVLDADGACVIAKDRADEVVAAARRRVEHEQVIRKRYEAGELSLDLNNLRKMLERGPRP
jgi:4-hydroxy-4-methyl-2-oxoglutarate aldolase